MVWTKGKGGLAQKESIGVLWFGDRGGESLGRDTVWEGWSVPSVVGSARPSYSKRGSGGASQRGGRLLMPLQVTQRFPAPSAYPSHQPSLTLVTHTNQQTGF